MSILLILSKTTDRKEEPKMKKLLMMIVAAAVAAVAGFAHAETNITESLTLTAATDWSDQKVRLAQGASIDLNGHSLSVGGFAEYLPLEYVVADGNQWVIPRCKERNYPRGSLDHARSMNRKHPDGLHRNC